jgi:GMP synthase (glutamine-hydrolysing)
MNETTEVLPYIAVLDFGGQYAHLIANRLRRMGVLSRIHPSYDKAKNFSNCQGIILSGGPSSVYEEGAPQIDPKLFNLGLPVLGICYGHQIMCQTLGGSVVRGDVQEFGIANLTLSDSNHALSKSIPDTSRMWMSHGDKVETIPQGFKTLGVTPDCDTAFIGDDSRQFYGIQFHPEVTHSKYGFELMENFIGLCKIEKTWDMDSYQALISAEMLKKVPADKKVFLLVSGGVDSTVAFVLLNKIFGKNRVLGLHIDIGLMRYKESENVVSFLKDEGLDNLKVVNASDLFLSRLAGMSEPEAKRKIIGDTFIDVKNSEIESLGLDPEEWIMAQGTIYPDTIESGGTENSVTIKTHHNRVPSVVELIEKGLVIEPLADLYKDEVRDLGERMGIPKSLIWRHPFPGPGLGVRLLCDKGPGFPINTEADEKIQSALNDLKVSGTVLPIKSVGVQGDLRSYAHPLLLTSELSWTQCEEFSTNLTNRFRDINRLVYKIGARSDKYTPIQQFCEPTPIEFLQKIDDACTKFLIDEKLYESIWQMPVVLLPLNNDGLPVVVLRPVNSTEAMTANFAEIDQDLLHKLWLSLKEMGLGALLYDITHKPPGTIEWE